MPLRLTVCFFLLCSLFFSNPCFAHKVRIFAWGEGETIHTEAKFSGGRPAQNATVTVINNNTGDELLRGTTDKQGLFLFPAPDSQIEEINIVINSGDGHKNSWLYQLSQTDNSFSEPSHTHETQDTVENEPLATKALTEERLSQIINESLEKKLAPIRRQLAQDQEKGPDIKDILGGIGYILGLAGIAAYMKSKNK